MKLANKLFYGANCWTEMKYLGSIYKFHLVDGFNKSYVKFKLNFFEKIWSILN